MSTQREAILSDEFINELFEGTNFGDSINNCSLKKRDQIAKTLRDQITGYWSGRTSYGIAVRGGFLIDAKYGQEKKLTALGVAFLNHHQNPELLEQK